MRSLSDSQSTHVPAAAAERFAPSRSFGWLWLLALTALCALPLLMLLQPGIADEDPVAVPFVLGITLPLVAFLLAALVSLPAMRYELTPDELVISCGPLLRYRLPYAEITDVRRANLLPSLWSSMRMPGLALWKVPYAQEGTIRMCATRMANGILLINTTSGRYGITPAEEARFAAALVARLPRGTVSSSTVQNALYQTSDA